MTEDKNEFTVADKDMCLTYIKSEEKIIVKIESKHIEMNLYPNDQSFRKFIGFALGFDKLSQKIIAWTIMLMQDAGHLPKVI